MVEFGWGDFLLGGLVVGVLGLGEIKKWVEFIFEGSKKRVEFYVFVQKLS